MKFAFKQEHSSTRKASPLIGLSMITLCALAARPVAASVNIVKDGGFETAQNGVYNAPDSIGDGWTVTSGQSIIWHDRGAYTGRQYASFNTGPGSITQILATKPGRRYDLSFYVHADIGEVPDIPANSFSVMFGGATVTGIPSTLPYTVFGPAGYMHYTAHGLQATSAGAELTFNGGTANEIDLDNVSVTAAAVPEPSSAAAFAFGGLGALGLILKARKRKATD